MAPRLTLSVHHILPERGFWPIRLGIAGDAARGRLEGNDLHSSTSWHRPAPALAAAAGVLVSRKELGKRPRLQRAARGGASKAPEPRARGPRSERDVANDVVFGVVAVDLLFNHDRLDEEVGEAFRRSVYDPAWKRLRYYSDSTAPEARSPAKSWRLQDRTLERQFSCYYTEQATRELQLSRMQDPLVPSMQRTSRSLLEEAGVRATDDPVSNALIAWMAHNLQVSTDSSSDAEWLHCRGRPWGYAVGKPEVSEWLLPVFVEHDRSSHAERMALLAVGNLVKSSGGKLHPDSHVKGMVSVYATHTPCISCMAVFCQFKQRLPDVKLYVCFDKWGETNRWIDEPKTLPQEEEDADKDG